MCRYLVDDRRPCFDVRLPPPSLQLSVSGALSLSRHQYHTALLVTPYLYVVSRGVEVGRGPLILSKTRNGPYR